MSVADGDGAVTKSEMYKLKMRAANTDDERNETRTYETADQETSELTKEQQRHEHEQLFAAQILQYDAAGHVYRPSVSLSSFFFQKRSAERTRASE